MSRLVLALIFIVTFFMSSCATATQLLDVTDEVALNEFSTSWKAAYESGDIEALRVLYEPDAWLMTRHARALKGREAILDYLTADRSPGVMADIRFEYEDRRVDGDYAFQIAKWWLILRTYDGKETSRDSGRSLVIFKRADDDTWRLWRDIDNHTPDVLFPHETMENVQ